MPRMDARSRRIWWARRPRGISRTARATSTIALYNPSAAPAYVVTTLVRGDGRHVYVVDNVPPYGRGTLDASDAAGLGDALGAIVHGSRPIYVERTVYHSSAVEEGTSAVLLP